MPLNSTPYTTYGGSTHGSAGTSVGVMGGSGSFTANCSGPITAHINWNPDNTTNPPPAWVLVQEHSVASFTASGQAGSTVAGSCDNGLGITSPGGTASYTADSSTYSIVAGSQIFSFTACSPVASASGSNTNGSPPPICGGSVSITYTVSAQPITAALKVDQDQQVFAPAATEHFSATVSNASGFTIDWVKISIDNATPTAATMTVGNANNYYINWPASAALNPSEHTVKATAQLHDADGTITLDSTAALGNGRLADDIIADVRLQSLDYDNSYTLRNCASALTPPDPDPAIVPSHTFVWNQDRSQTTTWDVVNHPIGTFNVPADDVQGLTPLVNVTPFTWTGTSTTVGIRMKVQAAPNTGDPTLTLYDNTTKDPITLTSAGVNVGALVALYPKVAKYMLSVSALSLWVKFTGVTPNVWQQVGPAYATSTSPLSSTLYALWGTPKAPMDQPWVAVLDKACDWAKGTTGTDPSSATTALATNFYINGTYNPSGTTDVTIPFVDDSETFYLSDFLYGNTINTNIKPFHGQCNDFSDFLVCLSNAIGAVNLKPQRSAPALDIYIPNGLGYNSSFQTQPLTQAPNVPPNTQPQPIFFRYHQWANAGGTTIYDGAIRFNGTTQPTKMIGPATNSAYYNGLVSIPPAVGWNPQPPMILIAANHNPRP